MNSTSRTYQRYLVIFLCLVLALAIALPMNPVRSVRADPGIESEDTEETDDDLPPEENPPQETTESAPSEPTDEPEKDPEDDLQEQDTPDDEEEVIEIPPAVNRTDAGPLLNPVIPPMPRMSRLSGTAVPDGLFLSKTAHWDTNGEKVEIELEVFTSGGVSTTVEAIPTDICLVLDQSGSMTSSFGSTTRQAALKEAVTRFIGSVRDHSAAHNNVNHRIGIVTFAANASTKLNLSNDYAAALNIIIGLGTPSGATNAQAGMSNAVSVMGTATPGRNRIVIMFTDGVPTTGNAFSVSVADGAIAHAKTLKDRNCTVYSVGIFDGANPDVMYGDSGHYTNFDQYSDGSANSYWEKKVSGSSATTAVVEPPAANRYMNLLSSNASHATGTGLERKTVTVTTWLIFSTYYDRFTVKEVLAKDKTGYYLSANNPDALDDIFESISHTIEAPAIPLGVETIIRDVVAPHFTAPVDSSEIALYQADCTGYDTVGHVYTFDAPYAATGVTASINGATPAVNVTGFDFNANFVTQTPKGSSTDDYGRKLIIKFSIIPDPSFFGGNVVDTNVGTSGVYSSDGTTLVAPFGVPHVDVPLNFEIMEGAVQKVYLGNPVDVANAIYFETGGPIPYQPDGSNNDHVDIRYDVYDEAGTTLIGSWLIPAGTSASGGSWSGAMVVPSEDKTVYKIKVTVDPIYVGLYGAETKETDFTVYRYRPVIETKDETLYLGQTTSILPTTYLHYEHVGWKCTDNADSTGISGIEPQLTLSPQYLSGTVPGDLTSYAPQEDSEFKVQVLWSNTSWPSLPQNVDVSDACWLKRDTEITEKGTNPDFKLPFWILVKTCSITVVKEPKAGTAISDYESFMIDVSDSQGRSWRLRVTSGETSMLTGLPIGHYTVTEDKVWSWKYKDVITPSGGHVTLAPNQDQDHAAVLVTNEKTIHQWITGESFVKNLFQGLAD